MMVTVSGDTTTTSVTTSVEIEESSMLFVAEEEAAGVTVTVSITVVAVTVSTTVTGRLERVRREMGVIAAVGTEILLSASRLVTDAPAVDMVVTVIVVTSLLDAGRGTRALGMYIPAQVVESTRATRPSDLASPVVPNGERIAAGYVSLIERVVSRLVILCQKGNMFEDRQEKGNIQSDDDSDEFQMWSVGRSFLAGCKFG